jgi:hypothetical protein
MKMIDHATMLFVPAALLLLTSCSSPQPDIAATNASVSLPAPAAPASPVFLGTGVAAGAASGMVHVDAVDYTNRTCVLSRADGDTINFKVGPEYVNFDRIKAGDSLMTTVSKTFVAYLVKGGAVPNSITNFVATGAPAGAQPGGVMIRTVDYHAKVLTLDYVSRRLVLQYGTNQAQEVQAPPDVNLQALHMNDDVLIRTSEAIAIAVVRP